MPYYAYVIYSKKFGRYYKGHCSDLDNRLKGHNMSKVKSTCSFIPWKLIYYEEFANLPEAINREKDRNE